MLIARCLRIYPIILTIFNFETLWPTKVLLVFNPASILKIMQAEMLAGLKKKKDMHNRFSSTCPVTALLLGTLQQGFHPQIQKGPIGNLLRQLSLSIDSFSVTFT